MKWHKLLQREGFDVPTIDGLDTRFIECIKESGAKGEDLFFSSYKDKLCTHYIGVDPQELGRFHYKRYFPDSISIERHYVEGLAFLEEQENRLPEWRATLAAEPGNMCGKLFAEFRKQYAFINHIYSITSWLAIEAWQKDFQQMLQTLIRKRGLEEEEERICSVLYQPWKETAVMEIQRRLGDGENKERLLEEFQFLRSYSVILYRPLGNEWIESAASGDKMSSASVDDRERVLAELMPDETEKRKLEMAGHMFFFKDWRDDMRRRFAYSWSFLFEGIASLLETEYSDLGYLTLDEISHAIKDRTIDHEAIKRRRENEIIIRCGDGQMRVIETVAPQYRTIMNEIEAQERTDEVKGLSAYKGVVRGKVRIVENYHDLKKVEDGDILVANTTNSNYLSGMKRAAAFVTNEGGIISHAAIVARELGRPCIVGTKIATKVLKNSEMVEVDATEGIVRKIGNSRKR